MSLAEEMRELFGRWRDSGQSLMAFGKQEGVSYAKLLYWRRKFDGEKTGAVSQTKMAEPELVPITVVPDKSTVASTSAPEKFEVWLANGVALDVVAGFDATELRRLVGVLLSC